MYTVMENDFPRIVVPPEIQRRMIEVAREFRKEPTPGERILWNALRGKKLDGIKFRRQQPVGYFVVDFYNSAYRLVIEVDGPIHQDQKESDKARQEILKELGLVVLRIKTDVVEKNLPMALELIRTSIREIKQNSNPPPPSWGRAGVGVLDVHLPPRHPPPRCPSQAEAGPPGSRSLARPGYRNHPSR